MTNKETDSTAQSVQRLANLLAHPQEDQSIEAGRFIFELEEPGKTFNARDREDVFLDLCAAVVSAFKDVDCSDEKLLRAHPLTPYLMRYLLGSVERANTSSGKTSRLTSREFAKAFLLTNRERKPGKMTELRQQMQATAPAIRQELEQQGLPRAEVRHRTIELVYERIYRKGHHGETKSAARRRALEQIEELLDAQGFLPLP